MKKISIITVAFNAEEYLEDTIKSVIGQDYTNIEYILIDGMSSDDSLAIARRYSDHIDILISEPDRGIYDAMNKGVSLATGDLVNFMNAGDRFFCSQTVSKVGNISDNSDLIYGDTLIEFPDYRTRKKAGSPSEICRGNICSHQSLFAKRGLLAAHPFILQYRIHADYEFMLWAINQGAKAYRCGEVISIMDPGGLSRKSMMKTTISQYNVARLYCHGFKFHLYEIYKLIKTLGKSFVKIILPHWFPKYFPGNEMKK